jgi:phosphate transport system permease protein
MIAVPQSQREAVLSLGATKWEATRIGVVKYARPGVFGATILGLGRAVGETMAVIMVIGNGLTLPTSLFSTGSTMTSLIANSLTDPTSPLDRSALIEMALLLLVITLLINIGARLMMRRLVLKEGL